MKVMFDSNIYISWIREKKYSELMLDIRKMRYLSSLLILSKNLTNESSFHGDIS